MTNYLIEFIALRISHAIPSAKQLSGTERWRLLFCSNVSPNVSTQDYIISRTHLRPREVLQFCKICINHASRPRIGLDDIARAEISYSEQKTRDMAAEYRFQYPDLLDFLETFRAGKTVYKSHELDELLLSIVCGDIGIGNATWALSLDDNALKKILWQVGFLKAWAKGGKVTDHPNLGTYLGFYESPKLNLDQVTHFQLHPACHSYLRLQKSGAHPANPLQAEVALSRERE